MPPTRFRCARLAALAAVVLAACTPASPTPGAEPDDPLRIVSYNIRHGRGTDDSVNLNRTAAVLRALRPDVVALQEVDERVLRSGRVDQPDSLGKLLGMHHAFGNFMDYQGGRYGLAILSRHPIVSVREVQVPKGNEPRIALVAEVRLPDGRTMMVINIHFDWVADDTFRYSQATRLTAFLDTLSTPYVLLGDFNDEPGSRTIALFRGRSVEVSKPAEDRLTFSSTAPVKEIDFVFVSPARAWRVLGARPITEPLASDHRPVLALIGLTRSAFRAP